MSEPRVLEGFLGFLVGASGMFATMYCTQAVLPELSDDFDVSASVASLTVTALVIPLAIGAWLWGPLSDRIGRRRSIILASSLLPITVIAAALAPTFEALIVIRIVQGLLMPGLLTVGVPYVMEAFGEELGGRAMGYYVLSLIVGSLFGRLGVAVLATVTGWRIAIGVLAIAPIVGAIVMRRTLPPEAPVTRPARAPHRAIGDLLRNRLLIGATVAAAATIFVFNGTFSFTTFRLEREPFSYSDTQISLVFAFWVFGFVGPLAGRFSDRVGWQRIALGALFLALAGILLSLPANIETYLPALTLLTIGVFVVATAAQIGVSASTTEDRGTASALYFFVYYACSGLGAYLPGVAWEHWGWGGLVAVDATVLVTAIVVVSAALGFRGTPAPTHDPLAEAPAA